MKAIKTYHLISVKLDSIKKQITNVGEFGKKKPLCTVLGIYKLIKTTILDSIGFSRASLPYDLAILLVGIYLKIKLLSQKDICIPIFIIAINQNVLSEDKTEYYLAIKKDSAICNNVDEL